jgi:acyl-CoA synthetase (AMP-forming)/AMP-acid ligase II
MSEMPFLTLPAMIAENVRVNPDRLALTDTSRTLTYAEFDALSTRIANALIARGIAAGDRVAYLGRNALEFYPVMVGLAKIGAVLVPLNWRLTAEDLAYQIEDAGARLVFSDAEFASALPADLPVILREAGFEAFAASGSDAPLAHEVRPEDVIIQAYTSGTTSRSKGVLVTNATYLYSLRVAGELTIDDGDVVLAVMPVFHIGGNQFAAYTFFHHGTLVMVNAFDPVELPRIIAAHGVTQLNLAPTMVSMIANAYPQGTELLSGVKAVIYGGAPITIKEYERIRAALDVPLLQAYAMTEVAPITLLAVADHRPETLGSVGRAPEGVEVEIRDPDTFARLAAGELGEVWVRTLSATPGYWNRPEATANLYSEPGWLRTGDIGHLDADGFLYLTDRISDMIITGGENVSPSEVERVLITHPDVDEIAAVGVPDDLWGEAITVFVVRAPGSELTAEELDAWARERIAGFRRPKHIRFLDELPRNGAGKILRRDLKAGFVPAA